MRRARPLPTYDVNGWTIERLPNTFAERFVFLATAVDAFGYWTAKRGFQTLREAKAFCTTNAAPTERNI